MNVHKLWMDAGGLRVTREEADVLCKDDRTLYVQRTLGKDLVLHPITRNGWAYKKVAELRGQEWPDKAEEILAKDRGWA
ncbi:hypothetical protein JXVLWARM_CDS_0059 [Burkholderia phage Bm1]